MARQSPPDVAASDRFASNGSPAPAVPPATADGLLEEFLRYGRPDLQKDGLDGEKLLRQVVELARVLTGASGSALAFRGEHGTICRATSGKGAPPIGAAVDGSAGITKQCLDSGISVRCDDIAADRRVDPKISEAIGIRAVAVVPIHREWDVIGILEVFSTTPGSFTFQHLKRLQQLAGWVGSASKALQKGPVLVTGVSGVPAQSAKNIAEQAGQQSQVLRSPLLPENEGPKEIALEKISSEAGASEVDGWNAVLLADSHLPWKRFVQSVFLHIMLVGIFWSASEFGPHDLDLSLRPTREARITYYPLSQSAPQRGINSTAKTTRAQHAREKKKVIVARVAAQRQATSTYKSLENDNKEKIQTAVAPTPDLPSAGMSRLRSGLKTLAPISPQPIVDGIQTRRSRASGITAVAPVPDFAGGSGSRRANPSGAAITSAIVPPPPETGHLRRGSTESADISIVPPPPSISDHAVLSYRSSGIVSKNGTQIVAPAPSFEGRTKLGAGGSALSPNGLVAQLVPPPASLDAVGGLGRHEHEQGQGRRGASLARGNSEIIAPSPSVQGGGNDRRAARMASLGSGGPQVVAPAPSVQGGVKYRDGSEIGVLDGAGSAVVAPAPGVEVGTGLTGRGNSLAGGAQIVSPPPSIDGSAGTGRANSGAANLSAHAGVEGLPPEPSKVSPTPQAAGDKNAEPSSNANDQAAAAHPVFQDAEVRVISLAWAPPRSSYFSSFEVFIAQKWVSKDKSEMIKLVYVFLPYQRRLSEYGVENPKIRRLRVTRDPSCDESLIQLAWPEGGSPSASDHPGTANVGTANPGTTNLGTANPNSSNSGPRSSNPEDRNLLPCYRTTADEYRRAVSRNR